LSETPTSVIIVSAPSGTGKSTALARVLREVPAIRFSVSHTTRAPRPGENDGADYHFVDRAAFDRLIEEGAFLEWAEVHGERYGTSRREYDRALRDGVDLLLDLDVQGATQARKAIADAVTIFILPPSFAALEQRLRGRGHDGEDTIRRRLESAQEELRLYATYDYLIVNDDLESCVESLKAVIRAARLRRSRMDGAARRILETLRK
jgi:guanylate kinase